MHLPLVVNDQTATQSAQSNSRVFHAEHEQVAFVPAADPDLLINVSGVQGALGRGGRGDGDDVADPELLELHLHQAVVDGREVGCHTVEERPRLIVSGLETLGVCTRGHLSL